MKPAIQSIKFNADAKLISFIEEKVERIHKLYSDFTKIEVFLSVENNNENENKKVTVKFSLPGDTLVAERHAKSFEEAVDNCLDAIKKQLDKHRK